MIQSPDEEKAAPVFQRLDLCTSYPYTREEYVGRILWGMVQATLFRFSLPRSMRWRAWLLRCFGAKLGKQVVVRSRARIFHPWLLSMGDFSTLADRVVVYNLGPIEIGTQTVISQDTYLCAGSHDYTQRDLPLLRPPIRIGSGVWIAAGAFVGPNITIGDNCVVGARSVVTKNIPPGMVVGGNPAAVLKPRKMNNA